MEAFFVPYRVVSYIVFQGNHNYDEDGEFQGML